MEPARHHSIGLRELRHHTGAVIQRVRHGETVDVTDHGRLVARIVPVEDRRPTPRIAQLTEAGRLRPAVRPGFRPGLRHSDGSDRLGDALRRLRDEEAW
jgi:prevent-host-death family protein